MPGAKPYRSNDTDLAATAHDLRLVLGRLKRKLREQAPMGDLSRSQAAVLGHLERDGPATVTALAKLEGVRPQSMGATVAALEVAGFVVGLPDPEDGRQTILSLTKACRDWIEMHRAAREDWLLQAMERELDPAEQRELAGSVRLLKRIVDA